jgi:ABC-type Fe2+-enterobactin transport system substrate-binding protein
VSADECGSFRCRQLKTAGAREVLTMNVKNGLLVATTATVFGALISISSTLTVSTATAVRYSGR